MKWLTILYWHLFSHNQYTHYRDKKKEFKNSKKAFYLAKYLGR